jgi:thiamine biosynthesis protein ThiI
MNQEFDVVMVRYDEIALKSPRVRNRYERILIGNIKKMLDSHGIPYTSITRDWGRIFIHTSDMRTVEIASKIFGISSVSPALTTTSDLQHIKALAAQVADSIIREGESFAIRARRAGVHTFTSRDVAIHCGAAVLEKMKNRNVRVDLSSPQHEIFVEVRQHSAYVYTEVLQGVGGLPLGTQGKMIALISGGIDSPVAAWLMMKRGCEVVFVYCNNEPFSDETTRNRAMECIEALQSWSPRRFKVYEAFNGENQIAFLTEGKHRLMCVLCRRMMYRIAGEIMKKERACGIITGASLGQVASQTSQNMMAETCDLNYPIYHPLIGLDKKEIIAIARKIGTYTPSTKPATCCTAVPEHPSTAARPEEVLEVERNLNIQELLKRTLERTSRIQ